MPTFSRCAPSCCRAAIRRPPISISARTVCRRAERLIVELAADPREHVSDGVLTFINRLSDFFFVASRWVNAQGAGDMLWVPGNEPLMFVPLHDDTPLQVIRFQL